MNSSHSPASLSSKMQPLELKCKRSSGKMKYLNHLQDNTHGGSKAKHFRLGKLGRNIRLSAQAQPPPSEWPQTTIDANVSNCMEVKIVDDGMRMYFSPSW